ncbi:hypothetical protein CPB85DRAFT_1331788 [Mucidula mucida]|nr:hypothetical protein CPB85DRAFT_1331788 [Mucidula mucida]
MLVSTRRVFLLDSQSDWQKALMVWLAVLSSGPTVMRCSIDVRRSFRRYSFGLISIAFSLTMSP